MFIQRGEFVEIFMDLKEGFYIVVGAIYFEKVISPFRMLIKIKN